MICRKCNATIPDDSKFCLFCGVKQIPDKRKALKRANGMGTVYKLQGRRKRPWAAAKNKVIIGYFETKTAALEALNRLTDRSLNERYNRTFEGVFQEWKTEHYKTIGPKQTIMELTWSAARKQRRVETGLSRLGRKVGITLGTLRKSQRGIRCCPVIRVRKIWPISVNEIITRCWTGSG